MSDISTVPAHEHLTGQTLLIDADDTLWENNIYFERAIASFISYLDHRIHTPDEVREHLNLCERATIAAHGYGVESFRRSLIKCFEQLSGLPVTPERHARIVSFTDAIASNQIELLPTVEATLFDLQRRHRLILVTKGNAAEQTDKLERSGLRPVFNVVEVLAEKTVAAYCDIILRYDCSPTLTWMIGNSPKSDINPALAAGMNAVFIPHDFTWALEHETVDRPMAGQRMLELADFARLIDHF
jgi:putative hydrolase of the HAD superfamily